ncbi:hypothetical protein [Massilioclostridium coli]|uniref:hypothetical protein n=1 Tax=Massilioclostridium coli TaxID=1870991 RepID=UPI00085CD688|nr:hypothetical protein [Massilioclostridium coli]
MSDETIKIFDRSEQEEVSFEQELKETESLIAQMYLQKENGNLDKARSLGEIMAEESIRNDGEFVFGYDTKENDTVVLQRRLLLIYTVRFGFYKFCPNQVLAETARNQFLTVIEQQAPHIYQVVQQNAAFSYYNLCIRSSANAVECIGATFAELCGHTGEPDYQELGKALYLHFLDLVSKKVDELQFQVD